MGRTKRGDDVWRLVIPGYFPPSLNETQMAHWSRVRKHKKRAIENLHIYALQAGGIPKFTGSVRVTITRLWGKGQRAMDVDNLYGAVKPLVDAMRPSAGKQGGLGIIEADDPAKLALTVHQKRNPDGDELATLIVIEGERVE